MDDEYDDYEEEYEEEEAPPAIGEIRNYMYQKPDRVWYLIRLEFTDEGRWVEVC